MARVAVYSSADPILYFAFNEQAQLVASARLPGTWLIQRDDTPST